MLFRSPPPWARHRAPPRAGGSFPGRPWSPSGSSFRPLLGITPEAPVVAAKFPEETRLPGRCAGKDGCQGRGPGSARAGRGAGASRAGRASAGRRRRIPLPGFTGCRGDRAAFGIWGGGAPQSESTTEDPRRWLRRREERGARPEAPLSSRGWKGRGLGGSPDPSPCCAPRETALPAGVAWLSRTLSTLRAEGLGAR